MDGHFVGKSQNSGDSTSSASSTSMAVRQFTSAAFGWSPVHAPSQPWRVVAVIEEKRYCLGCYGVRNFDVVVGEGRKFLVCRCCGCEVQSG